MPPFDAEQMFSNAQAVAADGPSTNNFNIRTAGHRGLAARVILTDTSGLANPTTVQVQASDNAFVSNVVVASKAVALGVNETKEIIIPFFSEMKAVRLFYDLTGALTATAGLVEMVPGDWVRAGLSS